MQSPTLSKKTHPMMIHHQLWVYGLLIRGGGGGGARGGPGDEACDSCQCSHMSNTPMHDVHMLKVLVWTQ